MKIIHWISEASSGEAAWLPRRPHRLVHRREITAPEPLVVQITAPEPPRYPVDDIKEMKECHLYYPIGNMSMKVGSALPCLPGALHHNNPIQDGYARVTMEDIVQGFEDLDIDIATPEGARRLGDVKRRFILWQKKFSSFQARRQQVHPLRWWWWRWRWWWWCFTYTSFTSADAPPIHLRRVSSAALVRPAGARPPNPPPAKKPSSSLGVLTGPVPKIKSTGAITEASPHEALGT
ncbi:hypothetical protein QYE76_017314 [Lolium multiflorum]|uniref:DUF8039 domain-containing protein n=1 Tax=Lolium multiflorum TaxID=4521 RepID=A0AAD8QGU1_LOLMU|nr:hypothetical protein QYE76_017314 [Lolium multiflorum]